MSERKFKKFHNEWQDKKVTWNAQNWQSASLLFKQERITRKDYVIGMLGLSFTLINNEQPLCKASKKSTNRTNVSLEKIQTNDEWLHLVNIPFCQSSSLSSLYVKRPKF